VEFLEPLVLELAFERQVSEQKSVMLHTANSIFWLEG
jgi:hypothetical protein